MLKIESLDYLVHELSRLPGIGPKTAQRLAYFILRNPEYSEHLQSSLARVREEIHQCPSCFSYTDKDESCHLCADPQRRNDVICVVEEPIDILRLEGSGAFRGRYHVLHGALSPLDRIGPDDLKITELLRRLENSEINEVILALDPDLEGDTTVLYLAKILAEKNIKVTRIASGVPLGSDIDYVDDRTLSLALQNRLQIEYGA